MADEYNQSGQYTFEGPVGIGVTSPSAQLHVSQGIKAGEVNVNGRVKAANFSGDGSDLTNIRLNPGSVSTSQLADGSVTTPKIADGAVSNPKIADGAVTITKISDSAVITAKIADGAVTTPKIADANVTNSKLANNAVTTEKIADNSITAAKIQNGAITRDKLDSSIPIGGLPDGAVTTPKIADGAVTNSKIADVAVTNPKIADGAVTDLKIADGAVTTSKIADGNVTTSQIADGNVVTAKLANNAVTTEKIIDNSITAAKIQNGAITKDKLDPSIPIGGGGLADGAVTTPKIADGNVTNVKLANNAVTVDKIANNSIATAKIQNGAITRDKLDPSIPIGGGGSSQWSNVSNGNGIYYNGGNVGIGTTNPQADLHVYCSRQLATLRIQAAPKTADGTIFGSTSIEFWSDPQGIDSEWRPAFIQSTDQGGFTGGLGFFVNGTGKENRQKALEVMRITNGKVGIGTTNPEAFLHVFSPAGNIGGNIKLFPTSGKGVDFSYDGGDDSIFGFTNYGKENGDTRFQWQGPDNKLRNLLIIANKGEVRGNIVNSSSRELKENITDFSTTEAIEVLANLNPVKFNYREDDQKQLKPGFIAEDVPELVATADRKGICALDIVAVLTKVIQQQQQELSSLKERLNALEASV